MVESIENELDKIETAFTDVNSLRELGFWKFVSKIKRDEKLRQTLSDRAGRIERKAFENTIKLRVNLLTGNLIMAGFTISGILAIAVSLTCTSEAIRSYSIIAASLILSFSLHPLTHYVVGKLSGINFLYYFPDGPARIEPSLKVDYTTYLKASQKRRAIMHLSGVIATILAALFCLLVGISLDIYGWAKGALFFYFVILFLSDSLMSKKYGDIKRFKRELNLL
ncbi:MAG TPA: hypothetical protein ENH28_05260 [Euryarchaeota archaeon]|nr:hypothetical protein BMS3Bbin15_00179 [archaeon BMS3Bbin15]HDL15539.1 hypothetical protein [Euryarchaeota archaeon]